MGKYIKSLTRLIVLLILLISTFCIRYKMYSKSSHPTGLDGYYYAIQAKSFSETGKLENPDIECGYYLCGICAKLCGDPIKGVKIWDSISSTLTALGSFTVLFIITGNFIYSILAFLLTTVSPLFTLMGINYINNQTGLMFLMFFVACVLKAERENTKKIWIIISLFLLILTGLSHKVSFVFSFIFLFIFFLSKSKDIHHKIIQKKAILYILISISTAVLIFLILFFIRHQPRFQNAFSLPSLKLFENKMFVFNFTKYGIYEIYFYYSAAYLISLLTLIIKPKKISPAYLLLITVLYFPFWNINKDMGIRLIQNSIIIGIPLLLALIYNKKLSKYISGIISIVLYSFLFITPKLYEPKTDPPYLMYKKVIEPIELSDTSLLIAHLGLNHVYTYYKNLRDCLNWNCDFDVKDNDIWRIVYGANSYRIKEIILQSDELSESKPEIIQSILDEQISDLSYEYILIKEDLWKIYLENEDSDIAETFNNWFNPHEVRPEYIRRKKKK